MVFVSGTMQRQVERCHNSHNFNEHAYCWNEAITQLLTLYETCEKEKVQLEAVCRDIRELFQPWPNKEEEPIRNPLVAISPQDEILSPDILLADKLLSQAHRARNCHHKVINNDDDDAITPNDEPTDTSTSTNMCKTSASNKSMISPCGAADVLHTKKTINEARASKPKSTDTGKGQPLRHSHSGTKNKDSTVKNKESVKYKPPALKTRKGIIDARSAKQKPIHMTAPFRTDPLIGSQKRTVPRCSSSGLGVSHKTDNRSIPKSGVRQNESIKPGHSLQIPREDIVNQPHSKKSVTMLKQILPEITQLKNKDDFEESLSICDRMNKLDVNASDPEGFVLQEYGSKIAIPKRLRQLCLANVKLQSKLLASITRKGGQDPTHARAIFEKKLKEDIDSSLTVEHEKLIQQVSDHLIMYENLLQLIKCLSHECVNEDTSLYNVMWQQKLLEFIFETFADTQEVYQQLEMEMFVSHYSDNDDRKLFPDVSKHCILEYTNPIQLKKFTLLQHQLKVVHIEMELLCTLEYSLKIFQTMDFLQPVTVKLYRCLYSLLCCEGSTFPSMVKES